MEFIMMHDTAGNSVPPAQQKRPEHRNIARVASRTLLCLALLVVFGSGVFILYTTNTHQAELSVQATTVVNTLLANQAQATMTNSPQFLYTRLTKNPPTINQSLASPTEGWNNNTQKSSSCTFSGGAYHDLGNLSEPTIFYCLDEKGQYSNFVFQIQMTILKGANGGIFFRADNHFSSGDEFVVSPNGIYYVGEVELTKNQQIANIQLFGHDTAIHLDPEQPVLLTAIALGKHLFFYINKRFVQGSDESKLTTGMIGLFATNHGHPTGIDVAFKNLQIWIL
jgi:hypothetical protein